MRSSILDKIISQYDKLNRTPRLRQLFSTTTISEKISRLSKELESAITQCQVRILREVSSVAYANDMIFSCSFRSTLVRSNHLSGLLQLTCTIA